MSNTDVRCFAGVVVSALLSFSCAVQREMAKAPVNLEILKPPARPKLHADSPDQAAAFFHNKRWQGPGEFPVERYLRARDHARALPKLQAISENTNGPALGTWQPLGPGNIGGRTRAIAIDPGNPNIIYAGTATGGVWKTLDGGQTWAALTDFLPVLSVSSLVMDPTNSQTLYLGTGEFTVGDGIFKTTNGGQTWTQLSGTANSNFNFVYSIAVHPKQPTHVYAATAAGVFASADGGGTWRQTFPSNTGTYTTCLSLALRSDQATDIVFASCGMFVNNTLTYAIYRNTDAAGSGPWAIVKSDPMMSATALAIAPTAPATIYAVSVTTDPTGPFRGALLGVFRSTQGGDPGTWTTQADTTDPSSVNANILSYPTCQYTPSDHHGQGSYNLNIAVDPTNANVVFAQGIDLFRSDDGGLTWGWADGGGGHSSHTDQHAFAFHPGYDGQTNQTLFAGNDGGIFRTDQARGAVSTGSQAFCYVSSTGQYGTSQVGWTSLNNGYASTQFYHGTVLPGGQGYFGGTQDNGTPLGTDLLGTNKWASIYGGDGGQVASDSLDPNTLFFEYVYLAMVKSTDGGLTNHSVINGITENPKNFQFINYYTQDPNDSLKMYTGGSQLWRSLDEGEHWTAASAPITDLISTETVDPSNSNHLLFGSTPGGYIYRNGTALTSDSTASLPRSQPRTGYVSRIVFDPKTPTTVYATYATFRADNTQSQIYRSTDGGVTWTAVGNSGSASLPDIPVHALLIDPDDSTRLYIGTDTGVFVSFDAGATWARDGNPFADAITESIKIERTGNAKYLYAFTYGRGVWRLNLASSPSGCVYSLSASSTTVDSNEQFGSVKVNTAPGCSWTARPGKTFVTIQSPAGGSGPGTVYFEAKYNVSSAMRSDTFYVQDQSMVIMQTGDFTGSHGRFNDEIASAKTISSLPYGDIVANIAFSSNASDPVHSCTKSADNKTQWWQYTASANAPVIISVTGNSYQFYGDAGLAITAYPLTGGTLGSELGCTVIPQSPNTVTPGTLQFAASAGTTYAIEISGINSNTAYIVLDVSVLPVISLTPSSLSLAAGKSQQFSAAVLNTPNSAVRWSVSPMVGSVNSAGLYTAPALISTSTVVNVIARSFANPNASATAAITVIPPPTSFTPAGVSSAASYQGGAVSPGEMIVLYGASLGPDTLIGAALDSSGKVATKLSGTQVLFDSLPAPLIYTSAGQLSALVPYEVAGRPSTQVQVLYNGQTTPAVTIPVTDAIPGLFTVDSSGKGTAAILNQDGLLNSAQFAAPPGSVVTLFGTGEGVTTPVGVDGQLAGTVLPKPNAPISVQIGGLNAAVQYAGAAPGNVAGVFQINAVVPLAANPGPQPIVVTAGTHSSPSGVTINVLGPDGRKGQVAYNNTGTDTISVSVFKPGDMTNPIFLGTVAGGKYYLLSNTVLPGSDWGIQVNSSPIRVISQVCGFTVTTTIQYWACTGTSAAPFPR